MSKFTVSILCYKALSLARSCIRTVLQNSPPDTQLILTDNGSPGEVGAFFDSVARESPGRVRVIHNLQNMGFIEPNRLALEMTDTEFFVMLNDDTTVPPGWLEAMEQPFREFPKAALSGLSGGCQSLTHDFHGRQGGNFEYLEGSCLMCSTKIVKEIGLFSPYLEFAYGEDSDLSLRVRRMGYTLHMVNVALNHVRAATARYVPNISQIQAKNHSVLRKKWNHYIRVRKFDYPIVIRRWAARGDVLLVTAILKKLAEENPLSPIYIETAFPEIFRGNPYVKHSAEKIDRAFDTRTINLDMGYESRIRTHIVHAYAEIAGVQLTNYYTNLFPEKREVVYAETLLKKGRWCAIHAGPTTWPGKNWPDERWNELALLLRREYGLKIVLCGHSDHTPLSNDRDLRGLTDTHQLCAVLARCALFIGLDSFPMHVSQAAGCPTIGLFGVTSPEFIMTEGSWKLGIASDIKIRETGARHLTAGVTSIPTTGEAMRSITVDQVMGAVAQIIKVKEPVSI